MHDFDFRKVRLWLRYERPEQYEWDNKRNRSNAAKHGVDFTLMHEFDWDTALVAYDDAHGEPVERERKLRIISLRKAKAREKRNYEQGQTNS